MAFTIAVDFDGTLSSYEQGFIGPDVFGQPIMPVVESLQLLKRMGWKIIIFTCREKSEGMIKWLKEHEVPFDEINENSDNPKGTSPKPFAHVYLDDRALNYGGQDAHTLMDQIFKLMEEEH